LRVSVSSIAVKKQLIAGLATCPKVQGCCDDFKAGQTLTCKGEIALEKDAKDIF